MISWLPIQIQTEPNQTFKEWWKEIVHTIQSNGEEASRDEYSNKSQNKTFFNILHLYSNMTIELNYELNKSSL